MGECECALTADVDAGYWQVAMFEKAKDKTGFFTPHRKKHFNNLPMGIENVAAFFVFLMLNLKGEWDDNFFKTEQGRNLIKEGNVVVAHGVINK